MNLADLRSFVRTQLDLPEEDDLPTTLLDSYIREGYNRTIQRERQWPSFETSWSVTSTADRTVDLTSEEIAGIASVKAVTNNYRLRFIGHDLAEDSFRGSTASSGSPRWFSLWGTTMYLWPTSEESLELTIRGWRKPRYTWLTDVAQEVDADHRLHIPIAHYACSLAYAQQEDDLLEAMYLRRWQEGLNDAHRDIMRPSHDRPLVYAGGLRAVPMGRQYEIEV